MTRQQQRSYFAPQSHLDLTDPAGEAVPLLGFGLLRVAVGVGVGGGVAVGVAVEVAVSVAVGVAVGLV